MRKKMPTVRMGVEFLGIGLGLWDTGYPVTAGDEFEDERIQICRLVARCSASLSAVCAEPSRGSLTFVLEFAGVDSERYEAKALREYLILDQRRIVPDVCRLDRYRWHLLYISRLSNLLAELTAEQQVLTSATMIRRKALAMLASTPTRSNSMASLDNRPIAM